jgi:Flp pilus assembly protein TadG
MILAVVDFGWALRAYIVETNAAREGARYWAINGTPTGGCSDVASVVTARASSLSSLTITEKIDGATTTSCAATTPSAVTVSVSYTYSFITPIGGVFRLISSGNLGSTLTMTSSAIMRVE